ncbi:hypothetical protein M9458_030186, partial [Cirrhinus mrigala]
SICNHHLYGPSRLSCPASSTLVSNCSAITMYFWAIVCIPPPMALSVSSFHPALLLSSSTQAPPMPLVTMAPPQSVDKSAPLWLLVPSAPPGTIIFTAPPDSLILLAPPQSVITLPSPWTSGPLGTPCPSTSMSLTQAPPRSVDQSALLWLLTPSAPPATVVITAPADSLVLPAPLKSVITLPSTQTSINKALATPCLSTPTALSVSSFSPAPPLPLVTEASPWPLRFYSSACVSTSFSSVSIVCPHGIFKVISTMSPPSLNSTMGLRHGCALGLLYLATPTITHLLSVVHLPAFLTAQDCTFLGDFIVMDF